MNEFIGTLLLFSALLLAPLLLGVLYVPVFFIGRAVGKRNISKYSIYIVKGMRITFLELLFMGLILLLFSLLWGSFNLGVQICFVYFLGKYIGGKS